jgi:hypothetical protein
MRAAALNRLCKWRALLAGWHLGTRPRDEPGVQAMRDLRELTLIMRAELNAMVGLMVSKGVFSAEEYQRAMAREAVEMDTDMERRFPGYRASEHGLVIYDSDLAHDTCERLGFPP